MDGKLAYQQALNYLLQDVARFTRHTGGLKLRQYQLEPARAVINSVVEKLGQAFVIIFPRQSGKNELQAQIQAFLLVLFSRTTTEMVAISPTWKPQTFNAMHRLESVLQTNLLTNELWQKKRDYIYKIGKARCYFLSGSPTTNIVGATANLLLSIDEAQDILIDKYDKEIAPMAASTNATRVFWGTAWTSNTLLAREEAAARAAQDEDGIPRVWRLTCDQVAAEVPAYGKFVADQVKKLGRNHPMVRTQYYSEDIDALGGLFPVERQTLIIGIHPPQSKPDPNQVYVMALDVAGQDEEDQSQDLNDAARDATALTIARVNLSTLSDPGILKPTYEIVYRQVWVGVKHTAIYAQVLSLARFWAVKHLICDATGIGAGLTSFLSAALGNLVIPFSFNRSSKAKLGWDFLSLIDTGRLKSYASVDRPQAVPGGSQHYEMLAILDELFYQQLSFCHYEIIPGPEKTIKWGVPKTTRDPASGELLHDDLIISAALLTVCDAQPWSVSTPTVILPASDPLNEMLDF